MKVVWNDKSNKTDPVPKINGLEYYINRSRVEGIHKAYDESILEFVAMHNAMNEKIVNLNKEIEQLKAELNIWKVNQHGRKSCLNQEQKGFIDKQKLNGSSNRSIAKLLNVSEGTIRNYLKSK